MNNSKKLFIFILLFINVNVFSQDTTNVLFIGNSFVAANNLTLLFQGLAVSENIPVYIDEWSPGGISVGDSSDGTNAHSNNPIVFNLIKSRQWDYVVLQDKQGRFFHNYGVFTPHSNVIGGHLKIRDSVLANNPCANMVWFSGWAYQGWYATAGCSDIDLIDSIYANYTFLNDTANQIIAPIGPAWIVAINNYPGVNLWAPDSAHPSQEGSYLTACVLYATIFKTDPSALSFDGGLNSADAQYLRSIAYPKVLDSLYSSNLYSFTPGLTLTYDTLVADTGYTFYNWYKGDTLMQTTTSGFIKIISNDVYSVGCIDSNGCERKSLEINAIITSKNIISFKLFISIFPNPAGEQLNILFSESYINMNINILNLTGQSIYSKYLGNINDGFHEIINLKDFENGSYILQLYNNQYIDFAKLIIQK